MGAYTHTNVFMFKAIKEKLFKCRSFDRFYACFVLTKVSSMAYLSKKIFE